MRPTTRYLLLFTAGLAAALVPVLLAPRLWTVWIAYVAVAALLGGLDALLALSPRRLAIDVSVPPRIFIGDEGLATIRLRAPRAHQETRLRVLLDLEGEVAPQAEQVVRLDGETAEHHVLLVPHRRGTVRVLRVWVRWTGPLGLMAVWTRRPVDADVAVVPNIRAARAQALRLFKRRDAPIGIKMVKHVGEGSEFEALREYAPGLDPRAIHWKASARHRKLLAQEFRAERNHQVIAAVDTGHLMREPLEGIPKLDHAVTASLALAYACLRTGDRVGYYAFDAKARSFAEPRGGVHTFGRLQHLTASLEYTAEETNYTLGLAELSTRLRRRSFVVLFTDFVDTVTAELMVENVRRIARKHLVTFVALRDPHLDGVAEAPPHSMAALYRAVVADGFVRERELVLRRLGRLGVFCIDAPPGVVSNRLVNRYLEVKRRELV